MLARKGIGHTSRAAGNEGAAAKTRRPAAETDESVAIAHEIEDMFAQIDRNLEVGRMHLQRIADRA